MVIKLVGSIVGLIKIRASHIDIDSHVFRLHYRWTTSLCFLACLLVAASDFIGDPIQCIDGSGGKVAKAVNTYCWINSLYTINSTTPKGQGGHYNHRGSEFSGIGTYDDTKHFKKEHHLYYQWVPFILFLQGCLFYLPHLLWKSNENKMADSLLQGLNENVLDDDTDKKKENIIRYLWVSKGQNGRYSIVYFVCEALNFVNVIAQMFLLDLFFGGVFMKFGTKVIDYAVADDDGEHDPLLTTFPRIAKCDFYSYGPGATLENQDSLCVLPQNIMNEKIFIFMWFWFVVLATVTAMQMVWNVVVCLSPVVRVYQLERRGKISANPRLDEAIRKLHLGDYCLLDILGRNLDALSFKDILMGTVKVSDSESDPNENTFRPFYSDDDDDPLSLKRRMESEMGDTTV